jgi:putative endonuclease
MFNVMVRGGTVYIITNKSNRVLYTGVTSNLKARMFQHQEKKYPKSFSARYNLYKLVYYKGFPHIEDAIAEEKRIKGGSRKRKLDLITNFNPDWKGLTDTL